MPPRALGPTPLAVEVAPGSYVLTVAAPGRAPVRWPFVMGRGETLSPSLALPAAVPDGFVYVPAGRFLFGTANDEMRNFDASTPLHPRTTGAFLIARTRSVKIQASHANKIVAPKTPVSCRAINVILLIQPLVYEVVKYFCAKAFAPLPICGCCSQSFNARG